MAHLDIRAALGRERLNTLLADAEAARTAQEARPHRRQAATSARHANDPQTAEIAVTVVDAWQSRGLGTELRAKLADRARAEGIQRFTALVAANNAAVAGLLRSTRARLIRRNPGTAEYQISLSPGRDGPHEVTGDPEDEPGRWAPA